jgi:hypothetical protein
MKIDKRHLFLEYVTKNNSTNNSTPPKSKGENGNESDIHADEFSKCCRKFHTDSCHMHHLGLSSRFPSYLAARGTRLRI